MKVNCIHACMPHVICNFRHGLLWCMWYILASGHMVYGFYYLFMCLSIANEFYHWSLRVRVSPFFSFTLFTVLLDASLTDGQAMCVFLFKTSKQFSSDLISSGYLFSSAIDASAPDDLRGLELSIFLVRFRLFAMFRFHVIFLIWWITSRSSLPRNIYFDAGYSLSNRTDSRKNTATALFGLNIDNLAKLASALPCSIWQ